MVWKYYNKTLPYRLQTVENLLFGFSAAEVLLCGGFGQDFHGLLLSQLLWVRSIGYFGILFAVGDVRTVRAF